MKEIADKMLMLVNELEAKILDVNKKALDLSDKLSKVSDSERKLSAATSEVNARQRVLDKQQLSQDIVNKAMADVVEYKKIARETKELSDKLIAERSLLDKEKSDLEKIKELYVEKAKQLKISEANLEERKKNLRQEIFDELKMKLAK